MGQDSQSRPAAIRFANACASHESNAAFFASDSVEAQPMAEAGPAIRALVVSQGVPEMACNESEKPKSESAKGKQSAFMGYP